MQATLTYITLRYIPLSYIPVTSGPSSILRPHISHIDFYEKINLHYYLLLISVHNPGGGDISVPTGNYERLCQC